MVARPTEAVLGLGSSLGDREAALRLAVRALDADPLTRVVASSRLYRTQPVGAAGGHFVNGAVKVSTHHSARGLLALCKRVEAVAGRRPSIRWGDRVLDVDILVFGTRLRRGRALVLPHPGLLERRFALVPAQEVAPDLVVPGDGRPLSEIPVPSGASPSVVGRLPGHPAPLAGSGPLHYGARHPGHPRSTVKFFLDTANIDEIREAHSWGILDGVTTNPSLIAKEGKDFLDVIAEIASLVQGPVSAETVSTDAEGMIREGRLLAKVSEHIVVKLPLTPEGLKACRALSDDGIDCNVTLCFSANQALLAAKAGAAYISPFLGRLDDIGGDGVDLIEQIVAIYANYPELGTEVLAASVRHPAHMTQIALAGADVATFPMKVLRKMVEHPLTDKGLKAFLKDWESVPDNDITARATAWLEANGKL